MKVFAICLLAVFAISVHAQCNLSGVVNTYWAGYASATSGSSQIQVSSSSRGAGATLNIGSLILILQVQDGVCRFEDSVNYGSNSGTGSGYVALSQAGRYEWNMVLDVQNMGAYLVLNLLNPLSTSFVRANPGASNGQKQFQVVQVPRCPTAMLTGNVVAANWDGYSGGVVALAVYNGALNFNSFSISAPALGFRGGGGLSLAADTPAVTNFVLTQSADGASKGEGICGTPKLVATSISGGISTIFDYGVESLPLGTFARGAPANAGGGGNRHNAGGGGGGNGGSGGQGGYWSGNGVGPWNGLPGVIMPFPSLTTLFLGGGGGAGHGNNGLSTRLSGGLGGGIVYIEAQSVSGVGTVDVRGGAAADMDVGDASGGGGAGGTALLISPQSNAWSSISVLANGGNGGQSNQGHGAGGGGGGGMVKSSGVLSSVNLAGGAPGVSVPPPSGGGEAPGANGQLTTGVPSGLTNALPLARMNPSLVVSKPLAGFKWYIYSTQKILWDLIDGFPTYVPLTVELRHTSRGLIQTVASSISPALRAYPYTPMKFTPGDGFFFRFKHSTTSYVYLDTDIFCIATGAGACP